jgi:hypothetical protein
VIDIRAGSRHPLAWRGGDYRGELRAMWLADRGRFALPADTLVLGCEVTLPVLAAVFRALGYGVNDGVLERVPCYCRRCARVYLGPLDCPDCGEPGEPADQGQDREEA